MDSIRSKVLNLLENTNEWENRYEGYILEIARSMNKGVGKPRKPEGLSMYSSVSRRKGKTFDLRFDGQSVAEVISNKDGVTLYPREKANSDYFGLKTTKTNWLSPEASRFRKFFRDKAKEITDARIKSPEHRVENRLLKEFSKRTRKEQKALCNVQPVKLYDCFFQMPTPLKASDHDPDYSKSNGGGIDILARVISSNGEHRLCVMEVKDENVSSESLYDAMTQAVTYATFIAKLLRSKSGQKWWDFLMNRQHGKSKPIPLHLNIDVVTIMPKGNTPEFCNKELEIAGCMTTLHCHSLYYDNDSFDNGVFDFSGTYINQLKK